MKKGTTAIQVESREEEPYTLTIKLKEAIAIDASYSL